MNRKSDSHRIESHKLSGEGQKIGKAFSVYAFEGVPVANEKDKGADNKQTGHIKKPSEMPPFVFDIQHGNTQYRHHKNGKKHGAWSLVE